MMGITRYMRILALFDEHQPSWTIAEIAKTLETSASTLYRLVREMVAVGMLESTVESHYRLGPLFVEYYRLITLNDPLIGSGEKFLAPLAQQAGVPCVTILARLYGNTVMCVAEHRGLSANFATSYELGRPMPLTRGATSRAVLSTLPKRILLNLLIGLSLDERDTDAAIQKDIALIRKTGVCETHGAVDTDLVGISAPVVNHTMGINASISVIVQEENFTKEVRAQLYAAVSSSSRLVESFMDGFPD